jgi:hypothetical protein
MKSNQELSKAELNYKRKNLLILLVVTSSLILLYAVYFVVKLLTGTWQANNTFGIVGLGVLVVFISNLTTRLSVIQKEINSRIDNNGVG